MHEIFDKCAPTVKFVKLDAGLWWRHDFTDCPLQSSQAQVVPNQSVKVSYATDNGGAKWKKLFIKNQIL